MAPLRLLTPVAPLLALAGCGAVLSHQFYEARPPAELLLAQDGSPLIALPYRVYGTAMRAGHTLPPFLPPTMIDRESEDWIRLRGSPSLGRATVYRLHIGPGRPGSGVITSATHTAAVEHKEAQGYVLLTCEHVVINVEHPQFIVVHGDAGPRSERAFGPYRLNGTYPLLTSDAVRHVLGCSRK